VTRRAASLLLEAIGLPIAAFLLFWWAVVMYAYFLLVQDPRWADVHPLARFMAPVVTVAIAAPLLYGAWVVARAWFTADDDVTR